MGLNKYVLNGKLCVPSVTDNAVGERAILVKYEDLVPAKDGLVQLYYYGDELRAYTFPDKMWLYEGTWHEAIKLYDEHVDDAYSMVRSYVGQPLVSNTVKATTIFKGVIADGVLNISKVFDHNEVTRALHHVTCRIQNTSGLNNKLQDAGYVVDNGIAYRDGKYRTFVFTSSKKIVAVVSAESAYKARAISSDPNVDSYTTTILEDGGTIYVR